MASKIIPSQNRYFDPYQQRANSGTSGTFGLAPINTAYPQKYLSRVSNQQFLKAIGNNMVLRGLEPVCSSVGLSARVTLSSGVMIADDTVISLSTDNLLDFDTTAYDDTPSTNSHLVVFADFKYIETPDLDAQTALKLTMYHVNSTGAVISGSPTFDSNRNKLLICIINFTKVGSDITSIAKSGLTNLTILGTVYWAAGVNNSNLIDFFHETLGTSGTSGTSPEITSGTSGTDGGTGTSGTSSDIHGTSGTSGPEMTEDNTLQHLFLINSKL